MCLFPIRAQQDVIADPVTGMPDRFGRPKPNPEGSLLLPCGKCTECISKRALEWATRARHEISDHDDNCFLTLTYDDDHLPSFLIVKSDFQKFMKRLRKKLHSKVRYMVSYEYGGRTGRPHFHSIIFGYNPDNQEFLMDSPSGEKLFTSPEISSLWDKGYHSIGTANEATAYYIASYALKSKKHTVLDESSGELVQVSDSMDCSKRPAIGRNFFLRNMDSIIASGSILPRYYIKLLERDFPDKLQEYQDNIKFSVRSDSQKYAKFIIDSQKLFDDTGVFRSAPDDRREFLTRKSDLRYNRDSFDRKGNKHENLLKNPILGS